MTKENEQKVCPIAEQIKKDIKLASLIYYYNPSYNTLDEIKTLLEDGANPNSELLYDYNALQQVVNSIDKGSPDLLSLLLDYTDDIHSGWVMRFVDGLLPSRYHRLNLLEECLRVAMSKGLDITYYYFPSTQSLRSIKRVDTPQFESMLDRAVSCNNEIMIALINKLDAENLM